MTSVSGSKKGQSFVSRMKKRKQPKTETGTWMFGLKLRVRKHTWFSFPKSEVCPFLLPLTDVIISIPG